MHARITEEGLNALKAKIGQETVRVTMPTFTVVSKDAARLYALAIGDDNPLWLDPDYCASKGQDGILGPPSLLYAMNNVVAGAVEGLPGVHAMFAGTDWTWHEPLREGMQVSTKMRLKSLVEHKTRFAGRAVQQIYTVDFYDQTGKHLASADSWCFRTERDSAREEGDKYKEVKEPQYYTPEDMAKIAAEYRAEKRRGDVPLYFEDVKEGQEINPLVKGPYTVTAAVAYMQAWGSYAVRNHRIAFNYYDRHPKVGIPNKMGVPEPPVRVHWDNDFAREVGVPGAYDFGPERISWVSHMLTDWIGDHGFLHKLNVQIRGHNLVGDTTRCRGVVSSKRIENGKGYVDCSVWCENQRGQRTIVGSATVILPLRNA